MASELRRNRPHGAVLDWIADVPAEQLFVSAVMVGEIQAGIEITREQDKAKAEELEAWLDKVLVLSELRAFQARRQADSEAGPGLGDQLRHQG